MSKLYDATIIGSDNLDSWLVAAAFASLDLRVALVLDLAPDPEAPPFPWLPFAADRNRPLMTEAGLKPSFAPTPAFAADFQVISEDATLDLIADPKHWRQSLQRELQGMTPAFIERSNDLDQWAQTLSTAAVNKGFPYRKAPRSANPAKRAWNWASGLSMPKAPSFAEWSQGIPLGLSKAILAAATATLGAPLSPETSVINVAMLWAFCRALQPGPGLETGLREQAAAKIARRGVVIQAVPDALINQGRVARSIRIRGGAVIDTKTLITNRQIMARLLGVKPKTPAEHDATQRFIRATHYFKRDKAAIPEPLAARAVVVIDPLKPLDADNLMIITRHPRVPARETIALTMINPPPDLDPAAIPETLAQALPWLNPRVMVPDDTRQPEIANLQAPSLHLGQINYPALKLENVFPLPSEIIPGWGPAAVPVAISSLIPICTDLLKKYKNRSW